VRRRRRLFEKAREIVHGHPSCGIEANRVRHFPHNRQRDGAPIPHHCEVVSLALLSARFLISPDAEVLDRRVGLGL
jgi:hypothetical protein